ncbi:cytochrome P450 [Pyrenochaeta sp. MPI-SDFR-AT-0127]|nr:cytochrome P450 [Pyrenochaeta sp. MPI-SDFR-AT-0127]
MAITYIVNFIFLFLGSGFLLSIIISHLIPLLLRWYFPLYEIPGPGLTRWSRLWLLSSFICGNGDMHLVNANKKYGPVARVGPTHVIVSDPETIQRILKVGSSFTRGPWFDTFRLNPDNASLVAERDPHKHKAVRRILAPSMNSSSTLNLEPIIDRHIRQWINQMKEACLTTGSTSNKVDFAESIPLLTLDLTVELALGSSFGLVKRQKDPFGFLDQIRIGTKVQQYLSVLTELNDLRHLLAKSLTLQRYLFPSRSDSEGIGRFMDALYESLEQHGDKERKKDQLVDSWFRGGMQNDSVVHELVGLIGAGVAPTSNAIQGVILGIISRPHVYMKLQAEIDGVTSSYGVGVSVADSVAKKMPYLQACIFEGLRTIAPLFFLLDRKVPPQGAQLHGYRLPPNTLVSLNMVAAQTDKIYGVDPEDYRPERWLTNDEEHFNKMRRTLDLIFGDGSTKCLGVNIAYMEVNKAVLELFRNFNLSLVNASCPWKRSYHGVYDITDFNVLLEARNT